MRQDISSIRSFGYYAAAIFNAMFAVLASVTLVGIVFITRPQQPMHNVPPSWWIPLAVIIIPAQLASQYFTWYTVWRGDTPSPLAISRNCPAMPSIIRPLVAIVWAANFLIGFIIVVSLYKPAPGQNLDWTVLPLLVFITFSLTCCANVFLMLFARTATDNENWIDLAWKFRIVIDIAIAIAAIVYYKLAF